MLHVRHRASGGLEVGRGAAVDGLLCRAMAGGRRLHGRLAEAHVQHWPARLRLRRLLLLLLLDIIELAFSFCSSSSRRRRRFSLFTFSKFSAHAIVVLAPRATGARRMFASALFG